MRLIDPYEPCSCGSGKKYKFCCYQKRKNTPTPSIAGFFNPTYTEDIFADLFVENEDKCLESYSLNQKGRKLMHSGNLEEAIPYFRKAIAVMPKIYTAANNLSICLMAVGRLDEAIQVQEESRTVSPFPNPFGMANMATFLYISGDEIGCQRNIDEALKLTMPSGDACVKVCEVLARLRRHQDIIDLVDQYDFEDSPHMFFYSGVAAANLGDLERAQSDLRRMSFGFHKADVVHRYLQHIKEKTQPHTIRGDWPYVSSADEVCPIPLLSAGMHTDYNSWVNRRVTVDFCETFLNESVDNWEQLSTLIAGLKHPESSNLLWLIAKGRFGPDELRVQAITELANRGELVQGQEIEMFVKGRTTGVVLGGIRLNPDFQFGNPLPKKLEKKYEKAVIASEKSNVDWKKIEQVFLEILSEAPDYYPARYNYVIALLKRNKNKEALPILRDLVEKYPDYLFARATLLQLLLLLHLDDEADELVRSTTLPQETHPAAFATWMVAQAVYHEEAERYEEAYSCARSAYNCAPQMKTVRRLWEDYADWEEDTDTEEDDAVW
jgi:tetratricopeptide (TPR) repeat protein